MGMAPHENSGRPTILQDLFVDRQHVNTGVFSMCLAEWGGKLSVGGYEPQYHNNGTEVQWIPLLHSGYYSVDPMSLEIGSLPIVVGDANFGSSLVDSGTTFSYFPTLVFNRLNQALAAACGDGACGARREGDDCWRLEKYATDPRNFPDLWMTFQGGVRVRWPPQAYMFRRVDPSLWCQAFADNGPELNTVLGVSWMLHKDVIFDLKRSLLGVAEAVCPEYRRAASEEDGVEVMTSEFAGTGGRPVAFTALLVVGIVSSLLVAVGVLGWLALTNCGTKIWSTDSDDDSPSENFFSGRSPSGE
jgi:hypothetical protein